MSTVKAKRIRKFAEFLNASKTRVCILFGGAGSGKSYSVAQFFVRKFYEEKNKRFLVLRKTLPSLRITAYKLILELLEEYKLPHHLNKTEMQLSYSSNEMLFKSLDDREKIKSYEGNYIWIEEATEISYDDFLQLNLRLRRKTEALNQMYLTFNPISSFHWLNKELVEQYETGKRSDVAVLHSTYKDNPFLSEYYIGQLEALKDQDKTYYDIYTLGKWGVLANLVYTNWEIAKTWPENFNEVIYGLDFGYNNPSAFLEIGIRDQEVYEKELLYETGLTNTDLIARLESLKINKQAPLYADSAEPQRIEEIRQAGYNCQPCDKGSVKLGIDYVKRQKIYLHPESSNLIAEKQTYKWKEDKNGNILEETVKFRDHLQDAERYALYTHRDQGSLMYGIDIHSLKEEDKKEETKEERMKRIFDDESAWV